MAGKVTQDALGELIGKSRAMVGYYETDALTPDEPTLRKIADVTKVPYKWLTGDAPNLEKGRTVIELGPLEDELFGEIPFLGVVPAGDWEMPSGDDYITMQVEKSLAKEGRVAVRVAGESMMPRFQHGDIVHIQLSNVPREGVITLARNQNKDLTLKVLKHKQGQWELHSINPNYDQAKAEQWEIIGHAVVLERHMRPGHYIREVDDLGMRP